MIANHPLSLLVLKIVGGCIGVVGSVTGLIMFFGMLAYLIRYDQSPLIAKVLWLIAFFFTAFFGSTLYFFVVYRRPSTKSGKA